MAGGGLLNRNTEEEMVPVVRCPFCEEMIPYENWKEHYRLYLEKKMEEAGCTKR